ncbi:hypothetical protein [Streptomyces sp. NPDC001450]
MTHPVMWDEVAHAGDGLDSVVAVVAALSAVTQDLVFLHPAEDCSTQARTLRVGCIVCFPALQCGQVAHSSA